VNQLEDVLHPGLAICREPINPASADQDRLCAQGQHAYDIEAGIDSTINQDIQLIADRVRDTGKGLDRGSNTVKLSAAVIRDDHSIELQGRGLSGIVWIQNALEYDRPIPVVTDELEVLPGQGSKFFPIQAMKSSRPLFLPRTGATLPS